MVSRDRTYTRAEYEAIVMQNPDRRFELIEGELIEKMPTELHAVIVGLITYFLVGYLREKPIGHALVEARYIAPNDDANDRIPDISFITKDKGPLRAKGARTYMPDLAIEVQSPGQSDRFMVEKATFYLAHGSRMVWLIYPDRRLVEVLTPDERHLLTEDGAILGGAVLPDFSLKVRDIFPDDVDEDTGPA